MADKVNINKLLCFISNAKEDYSESVLFDITYSFYSIEENSEASSSHLSSYHLPAQERQHQRNIGLLTSIDELSPYSQIY